MPLTLAQDAIALLIDLAERGEVDPWDVKVIEVIDRFLTELAPLSASGREAYDASLSRSGQAFLYASMLVLLKADNLVQAETTPADAIAEEDLEFLEGEGTGSSPLPPFLERQLRRRAVAQPPQRRRVTLNELIQQLQTIAAALEENVSRPHRLRRPRPQSRSEAIRTIAELAHQENLTEMAVALEQFLTDQWEALVPGQGWMDFDLLLQVWSQAAEYRLESASHESSQTHDRVGIFWALLLLAAQSKVELVQEEFYRDLKIRVLDESQLPTPPH
jgi:segregation and condensation protein A